VAVQASVGCVTTGGEQFVSLFTSTRYRIFEDFSEDETSSNFACAYTHRTHQAPLNYRRNVTEA
jgi:hypothetical protein